MRRAFLLLEHFLVSCWWDVEDAGAAVVRALDNLLWDARHAPAWWWPFVGTILGLALLACQLTAMRCAAAVRDAAPAPLMGGRR